MSWLEPTGHFSNHSASKRTPPNVPESTVRRPRLERSLATGTRRPVTIVTGPAGAGKTTLLASWFHDHAKEPDSPRASWLTVDGRDNERGSFVSSLVATLGAPATLPQITDGDDVAVCADALRQVELRREPRILVLDDVHELETPSALAVLGHIVEGAPPQLDVVMATRADPALRLGRLRVDG